MPEGSITPNEALVYAKLSGIVTLGNNFVLRGNKGYPATYDKNIYQNLQFVINMMTSLSFCLTGLICKDVLLSTVEFFFGLTNLVNKQHCIEATHQIILDLRTETRS
jgi:hypothetical protein